MLSQELVGHRVVVRYRRAGADGRPPLSDLVGRLVELTGESATVLTRRGPVTVDRADIQLARPVAANRKEILELERISRRGWRAAHCQELDGWQLFADRGWTGRANSVLPLRTPAQPIAQLLPVVSAFYTERGLPVQIQIPMPARGLLDAELAGRCWTAARASVFLVRSLTDESATGYLPGSPAIEPATAAHRRPADEIELATAPDAGWLAGYHYRGAGLPDFAAELLTRHDRVVFASVRQAGKVIAIARAVVDEGWLGVTSVEVAAEHRRRGLAGALMVRLSRWGIEQGAESAYLQVDDANAAALALYRRLGFREHHRYHYRVQPSAG